MLQCGQILQGDYRIVRLLGQGGMGAVYLAEHTRLAGRFLARHLQQTGKPLPEQQVLAWADQILSDLAYLHSRQPGPVIHRDIKPSNIILAPDGTVHLVDFGLVKLLSGSGQSTAAAMRGMGRNRAARTVSTGRPSHPLFSTTI